MHPTDVNANSKNDDNSLFKRFIMMISPAIRHQVHRLDSIKTRSDITIKECSELSADIQREVEENHFPTLLDYRKIGK